MAKIYFFDIDNTLVDHATHAIPASALAAIHALKKENHTIIVATGRSYGHAKPYVDQLEPSYTITQNGACIVKDDNVVFSAPLPRQSLIDLFDWVKAKGLQFGINRDTIAFVSEEAPGVLASLASVKMGTKIDTDFFRHNDVYQGWLFFDESLDATLSAEIMARYPEFELLRWHKTGVDVQDRTINKWTGCQWVMKQLGFQKEQAIAFGDGLNDIPMLKGVGLGIAVGNARPELKAIADRVALPIDQDGIAKMLAELAKEKV